MNYSRLKIIMTLAFATFISIISFAQSPTHLPRQAPKPVNFFESTENILFFVVIPVVIVVLYFVWKTRLKREKKEENQ